MNTLLIGFLIGCAFGAILFLGGATSYRRIIGTLLLKDMWIIKLMMTAIGVGTLGIYLLDMGGLANMSIKPAYVWGIVAGGAIFGIGWAVAGYCPGTCVVGSAEGNLTLSNERAESVKAHLVGRGVASGRIQVEGRGDAEPVGSNDTEEGRAANRRVVVQILDIE